MCLSKEHFPEILIQHADLGIDRFEVLVAKVVC